MKLYIKQKVFSWRDRFAVKDESGADRYFAQGEIFTWGRKLHVYDAQGNEAAFIRQKVMAWMPRYFIEMNGVTYTMKKEFTFMRPKFTIDGVNWQMSGDFWAHEYEVSDGSAAVMSMSKQWFTWGDSYQLDIPDPRNELLCLCVALTVDCMKADEDASRKGIH